MPPLVKVIRKKPVLGDLQGDVSAVLTRMKTQFLRQLRQQVMLTGFSRAAKVAFAKHMKVEVKPSSIVLTVNHPAWVPLVGGQRRRQMIWLNKSPTPIPIVSETGKVIFRSASAKSMKDGKWWHPGRKPSNFVETARKNVKAWAKKALPDLLRREIAQTLQGK